MSTDDDGKDWSGPELLQGPLPSPRVTNALLGGYVGVVLSDLVSIYLVPGSLLGILGQVIPGLLWHGTLVDRAWWSLLLTPLVHAHPLQLAANIILVMLLVPAAERLFGRWRTLFVYLSAAIVGCIASAALLPNQAVVGASAGLLGIVGLLTGTLLFHPGLIPEPAAKRTIVVLGVGTIVHLAFGAFHPLLNQVLHLSALAVGVLLAGVLRLRTGDSPPLPLSVAVSVLLCTGVTLALARSRDAAESTLAAVLERFVDLSAHLDHEQAARLLEPALDAELTGSADLLLLPDAQNGLAWTYVKLGRETEKAIRLSEDSNRVTQHRLPAFLDTLGYLYAIAGRCREAADAMGRAAEMDRRYEERRKEVNRACAKGERPDPDIAGPELPPEQGLPTPSPPKRGVRI